MKFDTRFWKRFARWLDGYLLFGIALVGLLRWSNLVTGWGTVLVLSLTALFTILFMVWLGYDYKRYRSERSARS